MRRKIAAVGLALAAVLALGALGAAGAQASQFTCDGYPCTVTGEQAQKIIWTIQGQKIECERVHFEGSLTGPSETIKVLPKFEKCTAFGIANAARIMNSCYYDFTAGTTKTSPTHHFEGSMHIKCATPGDTITHRAPATNPLCELHIPEQTPTTSKVDFENLSPPGSGTMLSFTVTGIHSNVTDLGGFFCPLSNASTDTSGSLTGTVNFLPLEGKTSHIS